MDEPKGTQRQADTEQTGASQSQADPQAPTQEPTGPQGQAQGEPGASDDEANLTDKHGQPAIARGKYERDMAAQAEIIKGLRAELEEARKSDERAAELSKKLDKAEADAKAAAIDYKLGLKGCVNLKAARAVLDDYDGDVDKLMHECPYLFAQQDKPKAGSTGLPSGGAPSSEDERRAKARAAAGLKPKKG